MKGVKKAVSIMGTQQKLASYCEISQQSVLKWLRGGKMDVKYIPRIIQATKGAVSPQELRPDVDWETIKEALNKSTEVQDERGG